MSHHRVNKARRPAPPSRRAVSRSARQIAAEHDTAAAPSGPSFDEVQIHHSELDDDRRQSRTRPPSESRREAAAGGRQGGRRLPRGLIASVEALSGIPMDDVRVHFDSAKPAQLDALAYTQGQDIHLAPGQESALPHEAWHVVQQRRSLVRPTRRVNGSAINDERRLEHEADLMGARVARHHASRSAVIQPARTNLGSHPKDGITTDLAVDQDALHPTGGVGEVERATRSTATPSADGVIQRLSEDDEEAQEDEHVEFPAPRELIEDRLEYRRLRQEAKNRRKEAERDLRLYRQPGLFHDDGYDEREPAPRRKYFDERYVQPYGRDRQIVSYRRVKTPAYVDYERSQDDRKRKKAASEANIKWLKNGSRDRGAGWRRQRPE